MQQSRTVIASALFNGVGTMLAYRLLHDHFGWSEWRALALTALVPALGTLYSVVRKGTIDLFSGLALAGIAISLGAVLLGGDPRLMLLRESLLTVVLAVACLVSLVCPRPLMFYFGRYFAAGNDPAKIAEYEALWQYPGFRRVQRTITAVWGGCYALEFGLKVVLVATCSIATVLVVSPILGNLLVVGTIAWTFAYAGRARAGAAARKSPAGE